MPPNDGTEPRDQKPRALRLRAADEEDLAIIAACLQDAIVMVGDMTYLPEERRFVFVANRFVWEAAVRPTGDLARTIVGVVVDGVSAVQRRRIDLTRPETLSSLLTMIQGPDGLHLLFSGGGEILLASDTIAVRMEDIGEAWPAAWRPGHDADGHDAEGG